VQRCQVSEASAMRVSVVKGYRVVSIDRFLLFSGLRRYGRKLQRRTRDNERENGKSERPRKE